MLLNNGNPDWLLRVVGIESEFLRRSAWGDTICWPVRHGPLYDVESLGIDSIN